jgi:hypothetical protein
MISRPWTCPSCEPIRAIGGLHGGRRVLVMLHDTSCPEPVLRRQSRVVDLGRIRHLTYRASERWPDPPEAA